MPITWDLVSVFATNTYMFVVFIVYKDLDISYLGRLQCVNSELTQWKQKTVLQFFCTKLFSILWHFEKGKLLECRRRRNRTRKVINYRHHSPSRHTSITAKTAKTYHSYDKIMKLGWMNSMWSTGLIHCLYPALYYRLTDDNHYCGHTNLCLRSCIL